MTHSPARRSLLGGAIASCLLPPSLAFGKPAPLCINDPAISDLAKPLTIDTHTHIFNGRDLQIKSFLSQTTVGPDSELFPLVNGMAAMLQMLAWHRAPDAQSERRAIAEYAARRKNCTGASQLRGIADPSFKSGYALGRHELQRAASQMKGTGDSAAVLAATPDNDSLGAVIAGLPTSFDAFERDSKKQSAILGSNPTVLGYIQFVLHHFNHRHVNAIDYLTTYSRQSERKIDLAVASIVDYDWWLAKGAATPTPLSQQTELMDEISVLLGGRVHGFAPYCPFRELRTSGANGIGDGMRLVKRAIEERGFIGVKLYPPMGFAAWGNAGKSVWAGKNTLHPSASAPDFGQKLDKAMESLFRYCVANDVPIMAHTNHSNGPYPEFKALAGSEYWKLALEKFPGLRVSFGHFGDTDPEDNAGNKTMPFLKLMTRDAGSIGTNTFADSGYFAGTLMNQTKMREVLLSLYGAENRIMLERLMYGSDWTMILPQQNAHNYLANFIQMIGDIETEQPGIKARNVSLSNAFFGANAVEFLGLRRGRGNRTRLETYYANKKLDEPDWLRKVGSA